MRDNLVYFLLTASIVLFLLSYWALGQTQKLLKEIGEMLRNFKLPTGVENVLPDTDVPLDVDHVRPSDSSEISGQKA